MKNLRSQILFIAGVLLTSTQGLFGAVNASDYYTRYTRQFLQYLGHRNPSGVPIKKMSSSDRYYGTAAGYATGTEIYLNEDMFGQGRSKGVNLFTCAHEAAHHVLRHPYQVNRNGLEIEKEADVHAARMLCDNNHRWVVEEEVSLLGRLVRAGQGSWSDGKHPTIKQQQTYLQFVLDTHNQNTSNNQRDFSRNNRNRHDDEDSVRPRRVPGRESDHDEVQEIERSDYRSTVDEIKDILSGFNYLSRKQKIVIAAIIAMRFAGWL
jgi:hypothetical protein